MWGGYRGSWPLFILLFALDSYAKDQNVNPAELTPMSDCLRALVHQPAPTRGTPHFRQTWNRFRRQDVAIARLQEEGRLSIDGKTFQETIDPLWQAALSYLQTEGLMASSSEQHWTVVLNPGAERKTPVQELVMVIYALTGCEVVWAPLQRSSYYDPIENRVYLSSSRIRGDENESSALKTAIEEALTSSPSSIYMAIVAKGPLFSDELAVDYNLALVQTELGQLADLERRLEALIPELEDPEGSKEEPGKLIDELQRISEGIFERLDDLEIAPRMQELYEVLGPVEDRITWPDVDLHSNGIRFRYHDLDLSVVLSTEKEGRKKSDSIEIWADRVRYTNGLLPASIRVLHQVRAEFAVDRVRRLLHKDPRRNKEKTIREAKSILDDLIAPRLRAVTHYANLVISLQNLAFHNIDSELSFDTDDSELDPVARAKRMLTYFRWLQGKEIFPGLLGTVE